jgi:hypothetical protein
MTARKMMQSARSADLNFLDVMGDVLSVRYLQISSRERKGDLRGEGRLSCEL